MKFRHELKYLLNPADAELIRERLSVVLHPDPHAENGEYHIRSLYFDDYWDTAYEEKISGVSRRRKYRIRAYNLRDDVIRLECKEKHAAYIGKQSAPLSREELARIWDGGLRFPAEKAGTIVSSVLCGVRQPHPETAGVCGLRAGALYSGRRRCANYL